MLKSQILDYIISIEKDCDEIKIAATKEIDCVKVLEDLVQSSEIEDKNDDQHLSTFCKFSSNQLKMTNTTHNKRICPEIYFTMAYAFQFHNNSSRHYESLRKTFLFFFFQTKECFLM